jgi:hypothetical protein
MKPLATSLVPRRQVRQGRTGRAPFRAAALLAGAVGLGSIGPALAAPTAEPAGTSAPSTGTQAPAAGVVASDRSLLPQAGRTEIQVPDPASDAEVKGQYGIGLFLLVLGGLVAAGFVVALFRVVMRQTWDSHHAPASQRYQSR